MSDPTGTNPKPEQAGLRGKLSLIGRLPASVPTPALVVDGAVLRRNIERMARYAAQNGLSLRPHTKTHKCRMIAQLQIDAGAIGLTVAKAGEAALMQEVSQDVMMAYPAVDPARCRQLAELARSGFIRVAVDSTAAITALAAAATAAGSTIGVLVEIDVGMGRTGVATAAESLGLAQVASGTPGVRLDGLLCYPGQIWAPAGEQAAPLATVSARVEEALALWRAHGLPTGIIAGGSTPTACQSHLVKAFTEIHPGTYVFNDMNTVHGGYCSLEDCAARVVCTVVSDAVRDQVVIDGGSKTLTSDICFPAPDSGHGYVVEYPDAKIARLSEEHGQVDVSRCTRRPQVGERVTIIPNHICPCVNLHDSFWWLEPGAEPWREPVDARGRIS